VRTAEEWFRSILVTPLAGPVARLIAIQSVFALAMGAYAGPAISVCAELFPTRLRATAMSLVYGATVAVVGGFAPLIVTWLIAATGSPLAPAFYVIGAAMISAITVLGLRDRFGDALL
jgi:MHS family proline/betaine transporter-like MFS transporter